MLYIFSDGEKFVLEFEAKQQGQPVRWRREVEGQNRKQLLKNIVRFCEAHQTSLRAVRAIAVAKGTGSFTNVRQATSLANTLAWLQGAKLYEVDKEGGSQERLKAVRGFLSPKYSGEPNISRKAP